MLKRVLPMSSSCEACSKSSAINAALKEYRFKAIGTVVANDIGQAFRRMLPDVRRALEDVGKHRTAQARGGAPRRDP